MSNGLYKKKIASEGKSATKDFESDKVSGHHGRVALAMIAGFACSRAISAVMFTGFGLDESYSVAISRTFTLSYFDHPPLHQWITHLSILLFGVGPWVRIPFVLIAAGTGWLLFRITSRIFGGIAGLWALFAFSISPYFFAAAGSWVSPDGILLFCLAGATHASQQLLYYSPYTRSAPYHRWIILGFWTGFAGLSKYSAVFFPFGLLFFLVLSPQHRHWITHPATYVGAAVGALIIAPVLIWNSYNDWISFTFQAGRALPVTAGNFSMLGIMVGGQIVYLSPLILPALAAAAVWAIRGSTANDAKRMLLWLGLPTIGIMTITPVWGSSGFPHWPLSGWFFIFPLLGGWMKSLQFSIFLKRIWAAATGSLTLAVVVIFISVQSSDWLARALPGAFVMGDPIVDTLDWRPIRQAKAFQTTLGWTPSFVIAQNWIEGGKVDLAVGTWLPVLVFSSDPRGFAFRRSSADFIGSDAVIVVHDFAAGALLNTLRPYFETLDDQESVKFGRSNLTEVELFIIKAHKLIRPYPVPYGIASDHTDCCVSELSRKTRR